MKNFIAVLCVCLIMTTNITYASNIATPQTTTQKSDALKITMKTIKEKKKSTSISGTIPVVEGQKDINDSIEKIVSAATTEAVSKSVMSITFSYKIETSIERDLTTICLNSTLTSAAVDDRVNTIVIDNTTMNVLKLNDDRLLGKNGVAIANSVVSDYISKNLTGVNDFKGLNEDWDFYVTDDELILVFDKYAIAAGSYGVIKIPVVFDKIVKFTLSKDAYYYSQGYNVRMLPIRIIAEKFQYTVGWEDKTQTINIASGNAGDSVHFSAGVNAYKRGNNIETRQLEATPEIKEGTTYVPISFLEIMLNLSYFSLDDGTILITAYKA